LPEQNGGRRRPGRWELACRRSPRRRALPPASAIVEAQWTAQRRNRERFVTEQPTYSILTRGIETDVLPTCQRYGMGVLSYSPLAGGGLSGRYHQAPPKDPHRSPAKDWPTDSTSTCPGTSTNSKQPASSPSSPTTSSMASTRSSPPGLTLNPADNGWVSPALSPAARRR
jgi:Aldo/keto reductase family